MKMNKKMGKNIMNGSDRIVSMLYIKIYILVSRPYSFFTGKLVSKDIENSKERISEFIVFKEEFGKIKPYVT